MPNFHCLFSFFEEDSFAVGDLKWVNLSGCGVSRDKLNPQHWKKDTVITVRWPDKKGQYQLYPAKILKMSGKFLDLSENPVKMFILLAVTVPN